ncbi:MAG: ferrochelatase, partial [Planctomycetes bacterium]|nr:ferrochelatase [Planctomycetota bacterium]
SAAAYRQIWTERGSPLLVHGIALRDAIRVELEDEVTAVELGMRYGQPSIGDALRRISASGADRLVVVPLFPQYSMSAWASAVAAVQTELTKLPGLLAPRVVPPFYAHEAFVDAVAAVARAELERFGPDRVLMSFHGLPERHVRRSDCSPERDHCLQGDSCCEAIGEANRFCYRAQCFASARAIAASLGLSEGDYEVAFQSRLGRSPWIEPYSDVRIQELARSGVRRLAVLCPSFASDCLETLEEIGIRAREAFREAGGEDLSLVPCVNSDPAWVAGLAALVRQEIPAPPLVEGSAPGYESRSETVSQLSPRRRPTKTS